MTGPIVEREICCGVEECFWTFPVPNSDQEEWQVARKVAEHVACLHTLLKHPSIYQRITGKHPELELARNRPDAFSVALATAEDPYDLLIEKGLILEGGDEPD